MCFEKKIIWTYLILLEIKYARIFVWLEILRWWWIRRRGTLVLLWGPIKSNLFCQLIIKIFWNVTPCRQTNIYRRFEALLPSSLLSCRPKFALIKDKNVTTIFETSTLLIPKSEFSAKSLCHRDSRAEVSDSISGNATSDLWRTEWQWNKFILE